MAVIYFFNTEFHANSIATYCYALNSNISHLWKTNRKNININRVYGKDLGRTSLQLIVYAYFKLKTLDIVGDWHQTVTCESVEETKHADYSWCLVICNRGPTMF